MILSDFNEKGYKTCFVRGPKKGQGYLEIVLFELVVLDCDLKNDDVVNNIVNDAARAAQAA